MDGDYSQLDIEAATTAFYQALEVERARTASGQPISKTVQELLADADLIWKWMAAEYQPPTPVPAPAGGGGQLTN